MLGRWRSLSLACVILIFTSCTGGEGTSTTPTRTPAPWRGGTLRVVRFNLDPEMMDPKQYFVWNELHRCCLLRTLMSYTGRPTEEAGAEPKPDLAVGMPEVSADGLTWTFGLKPALTYAPPFDDVEITVGDIVRAIERRPDEELGWGYAFYFSPIVGFDEFWADEANSISGLETPDPHTLVVTLEAPTGDLAYRFALPATAPIPEGAADGHAADYGRYLVSSGPYMIEGADAVDYSLPADEQEPPSGYVPPSYGADGTPTADGSMVLVRNPSWQRGTDRLRGAYVDRIEFTIINRDPSHRELAGLLDDIVDARYDVDELAYWTPEGWGDDASHRREASQMSSFNYVPMNLAVPPLDDVHVRRAISLMLDPEAVLAGAREIAPSYPFSRILPDALEGALLAGWRPSWQSASTPDLPAARAEMARSRYDRDRDGRCDASVCRGLSTIVMRGSDLWDVPLWPWQPWVESLRELGIRLEIHEIPVTGWDTGFWKHAGRPSERWGLLLGWNGWLPDFPNASNVFVPLMQNPTDEPNINFALMGATPRQLAKWGYPTGRVQNVDERIARCMAEHGHEQVVCWAELDQYLMEDVVPWIPLVGDVSQVALSPRLDRYSFDQAFNAPAYDQIALLPGRSEAALP